MNAAAGSQDAHLRGAQRDAVPMKAAAPLLAVRGLHKAFGGVRAVDGVDLQVAPGELLALIGPNGAGKSTTFNLVNGQLRPDQGSIRLAGEELVGKPPRAIWRRGVGRTFQIAETFGSFTVLQNVQMALLSHHRRIHTWWQRADRFRPEEALALLALVGMQAQAQRPCFELAYGDIKRVELAIALAHGPRLLLMDEPTAGMAPAERGALMALTRSLVRERQIGVLFTEHSMDVVFANADRIVVMARGRVVAQGSPTEVRENPEVQAVYFGSADGVRASMSPAAAAP
jgi:branched-chain amino acid transport system ATP-binding protein